MVHNNIIHLFVVALKCHDFRDTKIDFLRPPFGTKDSNGKVAYQMKDPLGNYVDQGLPRGVLCMQIRVVRVHVI